MSQDFRVFYSSYSIYIHIYNIIKLTYSTEYNVFVKCQHLINYAITFNIFVEYNSQFITTGTRVYYGLSQAVSGTENISLDS